MSIAYRLLGIIVWPVVFPLNPEKVIPEVLQDLLHQAFRRASVIIYKGDRRPHIAVDVMGAPIKAPDWNRRTDIVKRIAVECVILIIQKTSIHSLAAINSGSSVNIMSPDAAA